MRTGVRPALGCAHTVCVPHWGASRTGIVMNLGNLAMRPNRGLGDVLGATQRPVGAVVLALCVPHGDASRTRVGPAQGCWRGLYRMPG